MKNKTSRFIVHTLIPLIAAAAMGLSCDNDLLNWNRDPLTPLPSLPPLPTLHAPISTFLTQQEGYEEYVKMLHYADMFNALNQSSDGISFTAFVPTNEAMHEFYHRRGVDSLPQLSPDYARQFILYHTVKDSITTDAFVQKSSLHNLNSDLITIQIDSLHPGQAILNGEGRVIHMGLPASNGKVYVLSKAMTPLVETLYQRILQDPGSSIMQEALQATEWAQKLNTVVGEASKLYEVGEASKLYEVGEASKLNDPITTHHYYTLLNVSDTTFAKAGINTLQQLRDSLAPNTLTQYVAYHILQNQYTTHQLGAPNGSSTTRIWSPAATNQVFTVTYDSLATDEADRYILNAQHHYARFIPQASNIPAKNGYLHNIDSWLPLWEPQQTEVLWDLADYNDVKNLVPPQYYQPAEPTTAEQRFPLTTATCYQYQVSQAGTKNRSYSHIDYVTCRNNMKTANNHDRIVLNLGYMGSITLHTPTIVQGKYRVELTFIYITGHNFMRQQTDGNGALLKVTFDNSDNLTRFTAPYTTVPSPLPGVYTTTLYPEIQFPQTASHTLTILILDPAASTNSNFSLQFDTIRFIPLK